MCDAGNAVAPLMTRAQEVGTVEGSLYERLGGVDAITAVARAFDERAGKDDRIGARVSPPGRDDPAAALNQVLSDVIDAILDVRQAHRRVSETQALHALLDRLFADLRTWAQLLADQDQALGVSPLASMPSASGRTPPAPWHGAASNEEVRRIVGEHLDRLGQHLAAALAEQQDDKVREALTEVERGILTYRRALSEL
jgi:DNA-binding ferritin-like protein